MKLPITLHIESDSLWWTYRQERDAVTDVESLRKFLERWKEIYSFKVEEVVLNEAILQAIKTEENVVNDKIILDIILPGSILKAMLLAKEYDVTINCAFIQANGGFGAFYSD